PSSTLSFSGFGGASAGFFAAAGLGPPATSGPVSAGVVVCRLAQADQSRSTTNPSTAASGPYCSSQGRLGISGGVAQGLTGGVIASGAGGAKARATSEPTASRPLTRWYIRCLASAGTLARWPIMLRIWWQLATSARWTSEVRHFFSYS